MGVNFIDRLFHVEHLPTQSPFNALPGLGPASAAMLWRAGIHTERQLRELGSVAAYVQVKQTSPQASLNLLWALEGALSGMCWQDVARQHRTSLLLALDQALHSAPVEEPLP